MQLEARWSRQAAVLLILMTAGLLLFLGLGGCAHHSTGINGEAAPTTAGNGARSGRMMVYIQPLVSASRQPLGDCPVRQKVVTETEQAILSTFDVEVISLPSQPLPDVAYYRPRNRYRADKLLEFLANTASLDGARVIGITEVDISTTKGEYYDWGIFGLSRMPGSVCVVSTWRLRSRTSEEWFYERLKKVVLHELGHTFGLDHCPTRGCLMEDAKGRVSTVDAETDFCEDCRAELHGLLK